MKYLCLAYYELDKFRAMPRAEMDAVIEKCKAYDEALHASGKVELLGSLSMPEEWKTIRPRAGKSIVTDGPYSEAKELVGAFFILEAENMDEAVAIASMHPAAKLGEEMGWAIDVRPFSSFCDIESKR